MKYHNKAHIFLVWMSSLSFSAAANTLEVPKLLRQKVCLGCHQLNERSVGPSFKMIADHYKTEIIPSILAERIISGSSGRWGALRMPPQYHVSKQQAEEIAKWVLAVKGDEKIP